MKRLRAACDSWKENTGIAFGLYGTPAESLCYRFARIDKEKFGDIKDVQIRVIILILTMLMFVKRLMLSANLLLKVSSSLFLQVVLFHMLKYLTCVTTLKLLKNLVKFIYE